MTLHHNLEECVTIFQSNLRKFYKYHSRSLQCNNVYIAKHVKENYVYFLAIQYFDSSYLENSPIVRNISTKERKMYSRETGRKDRRNYHCLLVQYIIARL